MVFIRLHLFTQIWQALTTEVRNPESLIALKSNIKKFQDVNYQGKTFKT